jgi:hypothetical protein
MCTHLQPANVLLCRAVLTAGKVAACACGIHAGIIPTTCCLHCACLKILRVVTCNLVCMRYGWLRVLAGAALEGALCSSRARPCGGRGGGSV